MAIASCVALIALSAGCGGGKLPASATERQLKRSLNPKASFHCSKGAHGWDYYCTMLVPGRAQTTVSVKVNGHRIMQIAMPAG